MDWTYANIMGKRPPLEEISPSSNAADIQTLRELNDELAELLTGAGEDGSLLVYSYTDASCIATDVLFYAPFGAQIRPFIIPSNYTRATYTTARTAVNACFPAQLSSQNSGTLFQIPNFSTDSSITLSTQLVLTNNLQFASSPFTQTRPYLPSEYADLEATTPEDNAATLALAEDTNALVAQLQNYWRPFVTQPNIFQYEIDRFNDIFPALPAAPNRNTIYQKRRLVDAAPAYTDFTFPLLPNTAYTVAFTLYVRKLGWVRELQILIVPAPPDSAPVWEASPYYEGLKRANSGGRKNAVSVCIPPQPFFTTTSDPLATVASFKIRVQGYYHFSTQEAGDNGSDPIVGGCLQVVQI